MHKTVKSTSDRDKTDFLLVQYFSLCAPSGLEDADVDLDYVAQVLEPVLGPQQPKLPAWLSSIETIMQSAADATASANCCTAARSSRAQAQDAELGRYFEPSAMVVFARFSFMIRRIFSVSCTTISTPFMTACANSSAAASPPSIAAALNSRPRNRLRVSA